MDVEILVVGTVCFVVITLVNIESVGGSVDV